MVSPGQQSAPVALRQRDQDQASSEHVRRLSELLEGFQFCAGAPDSPLVVGSAMFGLHGMPHSDCDIAVAFGSEAEHRRLQAHLVQQLEARGLAHSVKHDPAGRAGSLVKLDLVDVLLVTRTEYMHWAAAAVAWQATPEAEHEVWLGTKLRAYTAGGYEYKAWKRRFYMAVLPAALHPWFPAVRPGMMCGAKLPDGRQCPKTRAAGGLFCGCHDNAGVAPAPSHRFGPPMHLDPRWLQDLPLTGRVVALSGPSAVGKSTIAKAMLAAFGDNCQGRAVSATTRSARPGEVDGVDYHFVSRFEFDAAAADGAFFEHGVHYGNRYGKPAASLLGALLAGDTLVLDLHPTTVQHYKSRLGGTPTLAVYLLPPSVASLRVRHADRQRKAHSSGADEAAVALMVASAEVRLTAVKGELAELQQPAHRALFDGVVTSGSGPGGAYDLASAKCRVKKVVIAHSNGTVRRLRLGGCSSADVAGLQRAPAIATTWVSPADQCLPVFGLPLLDFGDGLGLDFEGAGDLSGAGGLC